MTKPLTKEERETIRTLVADKYEKGIGDAAKAFLEVFESYEATVQSLEVELARLNTQADKQWQQDLNEGFPRREK